MVRVELVQVEEQLERLCHSPRCEGGQPLGLHTLVMLATLVLVTDVERGMGGNGLATHEPQRT